MFKWLFVLSLFTVLSLNVFSLNLEDKVVFTYGSSVVTESDIRAYAYIFKLDLKKDRQEIIDKVVEIEKRYYCLRLNYPFEGEFQKEFPCLFYRLNLFCRNRFLPNDIFASYSIDFNLLKNDLFKLLFVMKYSFLLDEDQSDCLKLSVNFPGS